MQAHSEASLKSPWERKSARARVGVRWDTNKILFSIRAYNISLYLLYRRD